MQQDWVRGASGCEETHSTSVPESAQTTDPHNLPQLLQLTTVRVRTTWFLYSFVPYTECSIATQPQSSYETQLRMNSCCCACRNISSARRGLRRSPWCTRSTCMLYGRCLPTSNTKHPTPGKHRYLIVAIRKHVRMLQRSLRPIHAVSTVVCMKEFRK